MLGVSAAKTLTGKRQLRNMLQPITRKDGEALLQLDFPFVVGIKGKKGAAAPGQQNVGQAKWLPTLVGLTQICFGCGVKNRVTPKGLPW